MRTIARAATFTTLLLACGGTSTPRDATARDDTTTTDSGVSIDMGADLGVVDADRPDASNFDVVTDDGASDDAADATATDVIRPRRFWWDTEILDPSDSPDPIWGDGHVHSDFSGDGTHPALEMMNRAKELGADFVWITDHGRTPATPGGVSAAEFDICSDRGRTATTADQFAGCGIEYRLGYERPSGTRVYEAWHQIVHDFAENEFGEVLSDNGYTNWDAYERDLARTGAYAIVTHPSGPTAWYDDDDSAFCDTNPAHHPNTELLEVNGGDDDPSNGNNMVDGINTFFRFLDDGWQVSPVWDSDMHQFYGGVEQAKGYGTWILRSEWGPSMYRSALRRAARAHRSFANHPGNQRNYIRMVSLTDAGAPEAMMGSTLPPRAMLHLRIRANIAGGNERWTFKLFTNRNDRFNDPLRTAGAAATDVVGGDQSWEPTIDTTGLRWVVALASEDAGAPSADTQYVVSAPIWLNDR